MLPLVIAHGITSALSGIIISLLGRYVSVISVGTALWAIGAAMKVTYGKTTPIYLILVVGVLEGIGVGVSLQPGESLRFRNVTSEEQLLTDFIIYASACRHSRRL